MRQHLCNDSQKIVDDVQAMVDRLNEVIDRAVKAGISVEIDMNTISQDCHPAQVRVGARFKIDITPTDRNTRAIRQNQ